MDTTKITFLLTLLFAAWNCTKTQNVCDVCKCSHLVNETVVIDCSENQNISSIPDISDVTGKVIELNMSSCKPIGEIWSGVFKAYEDLQVLDLHNTLLQYKNASDLFAGLHNLIYLDISSNEMFPITSRTDSSIFSSLVSLRELRMQGTTGTYHAEGFPNEVLSKLTSLQILWLDGSNKTEFGQVFESSLKHLTTIRISGDKIVPPWRSKEFCNLESISDDTLKHLVHVKELVIRKCDVRVLAKNAFQHMTKLVYLDLSANIKLRLESISKAMPSLSKSVTTVVLDSVEDVLHLNCGVIVTKDMAEFLKNTNISTMHVNENKLMSINPNAFEYLPQNLERLYLSMNKLQAGLYLFNMFRLQNLKTIDITYNYFYLPVWDGPVLKESNTEQTTNPQKLASLFMDYQDRITGFGDYDTSSESCPSTLNLPPGTITFYLPPKLEVVNISYSKIGYPIYELFADKNNSINTVKARKCLLFCWSGPVHGLPNLKHLDLGWNDCLDIKPRFFGEFRTLETLDLSRNLMFAVVEKTKNGKLFENNTNLRELDISLNHLLHIPYDFFKHQANLENLNLSDNHLRTFNFSFEHMKYLRVLDLSKNHISTVDARIQTTIKNMLQSDRGHLLTINLNHNDIKCSCENLEFFRLVLASKRNDSVLIEINKCLKNDEADINRKLESYSDIENLVLILERKCDSYTFLIAMPATVIVLFINLMVGIMVHRNRWKLRFWYYVSRQDSKKGFSVAEHRMNCKYDVFVAYSEDMKGFVNENLSTKLRGLRSHYRLFLQHEDSLPGQDTIRYIGNTVHASKVVLFIVSKNCWNDLEWSVAVQMAHAESVYRNESMFFGIVVGEGMTDTSFPDVIQEIRKRRQLLFYPSTEDEIDLLEFWSKCAEIVDRNRNRFILDT